MADGIEIIRERVLLIAPVAALIKKVGFYPIAAPHGATPPYIVSSLNSALPNTTMTGKGLQKGQRISVEAIATSAQGAIDLDKLLSDLLPCVKQTAKGAKLVDIIDTETVWDDHSDDLSTFRRGHHFRIHWQDA